VTLYHTTSRQAAAAIADQGFRDHLDHAGSGLVGVWFADQPTPWGSQFGAVVAIDIPDDQITSYEVPVHAVEQCTPAGWLDTGERFRTFLLPADVVNRCPVVVVDDDHERLTRGEDERE